MGLYSKAPNHYLLAMNSNWKMKYNLFPGSLQPTAHGLPWQPLAKGFGQTWAPVLSLPLPGSGSWTSDLTCLCHVCIIYGRSRSQGEAMSHYHEVGKSQGMVQHIRVCARGELLPPLVLKRQRAREVTETWRKVCGEGHLRDRGLW